jgi:hypothetical protein
LRLSHQHLRFTLAATRSLRSGARGGGIPLGGRAPRLAATQLNDNIDNSFVSVVGNIEVIVAAVPPDISNANFTLTVGDLPATARGGVVLLTQDSDQMQGLTTALQGGTTTFTFGF